MLALAVFLWEMKAQGDAAGVGGRVVVGDCRRATESVVSLYENGKVLGYCCHVKVASSR